MTTATILLAEDDSALQSVMEALFEDQGWTVTCADDGEQALSTFKAQLEADQPPDLIVSDINMPRVTGLEFIESVKKLRPDIPFLFVTAYSSVDSAVTALRHGAFDYLVKPFRNDQLLQVCRNALKQQRLTRENSQLKRQLQKTYSFPNIIGRSPSMQGVFRVIERAAPTEASLLIRGDTGTGKEVIARAVHSASERHGQPFISINCAALPEGLLESELFGHEKGAFTGAVARSEGLFRAAHGGTLFLDELAEMPAALQAKLLRVLETREVRPVGSTKTIAIDVRLLAATHRDLMQEVEAERFREDLYYRLAVIEVEIPPLRARPDDIPLLTQYFLEQIAERRSRAANSMSPEFLQFLQSYHWPGNVRELRNALEHAATLGEAELKVQDLPQRILKNHGSSAVTAAFDSHSPMTLADMEQSFVLTSLENCGGDRKAAAKRLGIDLSTLYRKLKRWDKDQ